VNPLLALVGLGFLGGALVVVARLAFGRQGDLLASLYRAPEMGWPHGLQEEDPPPSWGWSQRHEPAPIVELERDRVVAIRPRSVHRRTGARN
jgi:hypothetical protein